MKEFIIQGINGFLRIALKKVYGFPNETCSWGGYDTESSVEIISGNFKVESMMYISTGELYELYEQLFKSNETLSGSAYLRNYEGNLDVSLEYDLNGHVIIKGSFWDFNELENLLKFNLTTDQTYIQSSLIQLKAIIGKYGDNKGVK